ncbi:MAG: methyltransferase, partial [Oscillospiraceae bacterium]|nr:methyltransferase [Oscillospiraceae bacterium]
MNYKIFNLGKVQLYFSDKHNFNTDSILLAAFASPYHKNRHIKVCDLCTGCGLISVHLAATLPNATITAVDSDERATALLSTTISENYPRLTALTALTADIRDLTRCEAYDLVTANPPYFKAGSGAVRTGQSTVRHDFNCKLSDIALTANKLLKYGGALKLCLPASRLSEACVTLTEHKLEPKVIRFIDGRL